MFHTKILRHSERQEYTHREAHQHGSKDEYGNGLQRSGHGYRNEWRHGGRGFGNEIQRGRGRGLGKESHLGGYGFRKGFQRVLNLKEYWSCFSEIVSQISKFVKKFPCGFSLSPQSLHEIAQEVFGDPSKSSLIQDSIQSYNLSTVSNSNYISLLLLISLF